MGALAINAGSGEVSLFSYSKKIIDAITHIKNEYFYIGALLNEIDYKKSYMFGGYKNIAEYCEDTFGFKKTFTYDLMKVASKFRDPDGNMFSIMPRFKEYDFSKLVLMARMNDSQLDCCSPELSVNQIKHIKNAGSSVIRLSEHNSVRAENSAENNAVNIHIQRDIPSDEYIDDFAETVSNLIKTYCSSGKRFEFNLIELNFYGK